MILHYYFVSKISFSLVANFCLISQAFFRKYCHHRMLGHLIATNILSLSISVKHDVFLTFLTDFDLGERDNTYKAKQFISCSKHLFILFNSRFCIEMFHKWYEYKKTVPF